MKKKLFIIGTIAIMVLGWLLGLLFVADSVFGFLAPFREFISGLGNLAWVVFSIIFVASVSGLFFVGGLGSSFIYMAFLLFGTWRGFIISAVCIYVCSLITYALGDKIGEKPFKWAIGDANYEKANKVIGSPTFVALALLLPYFPDSLVCFFAGSSKMPWWSFAIVALVTRTIGVAGICFLGSGVLSIATWQPVVDTLGVIPTLLIMFSALVSFLALIVAVFLGGKKLEKIYERKKNVHLVSKVSSQEAKVEANKESA